MSEGETLRLQSRADGFRFEAWHAPARGARRGGLVVLHAIWGVTPHLRTLAGEFAEDGYEVLAIEGLSVITPTAESKGLALRHPRAYGVLAWLDDRLAPRAPFRGWGDFFIVSLRRR